MPVFVAETPSPASLAFGSLRGTETGRSSRSASALATGFARLRLAARDEAPSPGPDAGAPSPRAGVECSREAHHGELRHRRHRIHRAASGPAPAGARRAGARAGAPEF